MIFAVVLAQSAAAATVPPRNVHTTLDEMKQEQVACDLPGADYVLFTDDPKRIYVLVPNSILTRRADADIAQKLACTTKVASDRGFRPILLGRDH